jgi:hypothetical protein
MTSTAASAISLGHSTFIHPKNGKICKICMVKFLTLKDFNNFLTEMIEINTFNEAWCSQLYDIFQK